MSGPIRFVPFLVVCIWGRIAQPCAKQLIFSPDTDFTLLNFNFQRDVSWWWTAAITVAYDFVWLIMLEADCM